MAFNLNKDLINLRVWPHIMDDKCHELVRECGYLWVEKLDKGKWYEIVLHVKWSTGKNGLVEGLDKKRYWK